MSIQIRSSNLNASFSPELGGILTALEYRSGSQKYHLMPSWKPDPSNPFNIFATASYLCAPYPNRITNSRFMFAGKEINVDDNAFEHALHGHVVQRPWKVVEQGETSLRMEFDSKDHADITYPFPFHVTQEFLVKEGVFEGTACLRNTGSSAMPAGLCFHPYFNRTIDSSNHGGPKVKFNVSGVYPSVSPELPLPIAPAAKLSPDLNFSSGKEVQTGLDHCFKGWDGKLNITWEKPSVELALIAAQSSSKSPEKKPPSHLVVYSTPEKFAVEPQTMMIDGFNKCNDQAFEGHGVEILEAGEELVLNFNITIKE